MGDHLGKILIPCSTEIVDNYGKPWKFSYSMWGNIFLWRSFEEWIGNLGRTFGNLKLWAYKQCTADPECSKIEKKFAHESYIRTIITLGAWKERTNVVPSSSNQKLSSLIAVTPCDKKFFMGTIKHGQVSVICPRLFILITQSYLRLKNFITFSKKRVVRQAEGFTIARDNLKNH